MAARDYLDRGDGYSPKELSDWLVDYGFTQELADYGMENCGADWNAEAVKQAQYMFEIRLGYSYESMCGVLEMDRGFTAEQTQYAVDHCGGDWDQAAVDHVALTLEYGKTPYTREKMIQEMVDFWGFTEAQAIYAVDRNGLK